MGLVLSRKWLHSKLFQQGRMFDVCSSGPASAIHLQQVHPGITPGVFFLIKSNAVPDFVWLVSCLRVWNDRLTQFPVRNETSICSDPRAIWILPSVFSIVLMEFLSHLTIGQKILHFVYIYNTLIPLIPAFKKATISYRLSRILPYPVHDVFLIHAFKNPLCPTG